MTRARIFLIRHGRPDIAISPRTTHAEFGAYIHAYEAAGLHPKSLPPQEIAALMRDVRAVFTSGKPRSHQSAARLAPHAELVADDLFVEAPLASPRVPILRMTVAKWAVMSRLLWHIGFAPGIERAAAARTRAGRAAAMLMARAEAEGASALVAHGYFNWMIGRVLLTHGYKRTGNHRARYWNTVIYEKST